jgi:hypothetical protein
MEIDPKTHAWWGEQEAKSPGIWARVTENPVPIARPCPTSRNGSSGRPAGRLADLVPRRDVRLPAARRAVPARGHGLALVNYWQVRDTRTLYDLAGVNPKDYAVPPPHIALNDALGQSRALMACAA